MEDHINKPGVVVGVIALFVVGLLVRLHPAFADVIPRSLAAWRRSFGVGIVPQVPGAHIHPTENDGLPMYQEHHHRLGPSVASVAYPPPVYPPPVYPPPAYPPPAYGSHTTGPQHNEPIHDNVNVGNHRGISVAVVPTLQPPPYATTTPDASHPFL